MSFNEIVSDFNKKFKQEIITKGAKNITYGLLPFTSPMLNYLLHGGIPRGKIIEFFGGENSGKTTSAIDLMVNAQRIFKTEYEEEIARLEPLSKTKKSYLNEYLELFSRGPLKIVFFDIEQTFDEKWATTLGLDVDNIWLIKPTEQGGEQLLDLIINLYSSKEVGLVVVDSIPALVPQKELEEDIDKQSYGGISKLLNKFLRRVIPHLNMSKATLILINQMRDSMSPYKLYETPGGRGLKFYCAIRLMFNKGKLLDENFKEIARSSEVAYGNIVQIKVEKTKVCKPDRLVGSYTLCYETGIEPIVDLVGMLINSGVIVRGGSWFTFTNFETGEILTEDGNDIKIQGEQKVIKYLQENPDLLNYYREYIQKMIL